MAETLRHLVGKTTISGYLVVKPEDEQFFEPLAQDEERGLALLFDDGRQVDARLFLSGGKERRLKLAYTGKAGAPLRSWLKKKFPARKSSKHRGVLVLRWRSDSELELSNETVSQAEVELLSPLGRKYLSGAKPVSILHPAMADLENLLADLVLPEPVEAASLGQLLEGALAGGGWERVDSVGGGLLLSGGFRFSRAQLHLVLDASALYSAALSLASGFELRTIDLGVLLPLDGRLADRLQRQNGLPSPSIKRTLRELEQLSFLVRGPMVLLGLDARRVLR